MKNINHNPKRENSVKINFSHREICVCAHSAQTRYAQRTCAEMGLQMKNPWEEIPLADYENHMKLDSVMLLQAMNKMMKGQFDAYPISNIMILGIAGGNGLEHIQKDKFEKVYGVDVNSAYLEEVIYRYPNLDGLLECLCIDLMNETDPLPNADMIIANLLIEYIGYACFQKKAIIL